LCISHEYRQYRRIRADYKERYGQQRRGGIAQQRHSLPPPGFTNSSKKNGRSSSPLEDLPFPESLRQNECLLYWVAQDGLREASIDACFSPLPLKSASRRQARDGLSHYFLLAFFFAVFFFVVFFAAFFFAAFFLAISCSP
jgi:hypothetical protein